MQTYEIIINIETKKSKEFPTNEPKLEKDGSVGMVITEEEASKIDKCEAALLKTCYCAMRVAMGEHFREVSESKALENGKQEDMYFNLRTYKVDGEIGRFEIDTHIIIDEDENTVYNTAEDFFEPLKAKEWYKTEGYKDLAYVHGTTQKSYRKSNETLNRIRHQEEGGTPLVTLKDNTEAEGTKVLQAIEQKSQDILEQHEFTPEGKPEGDMTQYQKVESVTLPEDEVEKAIESCQKKVGLDCNLRSNPMIYEDPEHTVNISIDDVKVKKQKSERKSTEDREEVKPVEEKNTEESKKRPAVYHTIIHVEKGEQSYILNGHGITRVLTLLIAFLLNGNLLKYRIQFFSDGYTPLHRAILLVFSWFKNISILLDWYHLEKKCKEELSRAMKGRLFRNHVLNRLTFLLWYGLIDEAIVVLKNVNPDWIKNPEAMAKLIKSFERNRPYIPCYAVRKELGLRNSSNIGEKMNDLVVSDRQKHNGMSWSRSGSVALASLTALIRNNEHEMWFENGDVEFRLAG